MIRMAWRSLRARWVTTAASMLAVVLGAALSVAALIVGGSASQATTPPAWSLDRAAVIVQRDATIRDGTGMSMPVAEQPRLTSRELAAIGRVEGVVRVTAEAPFPAFVVAGGRTIGDGATRSWGHSWETALAEPVRLTQGAAPSRADDVVVDASIAQAAGLRVGAGVDVMTSDGARRYWVSGIADRAGMAYEHAVFFTADTAAGLGGAAALAVVVADPGVNPAAIARRITAAVPRTGVLTGAARGAVLAGDTQRGQLSAGMGQFLATMAACALLITVFVIASTLSLSVAQRRRELALLRAVGASPRRIRSLIIGEAMLVGLIGGIVGAVLGVGLAAAGIRLFARQGLLPTGLPVALGSTSMLVGVGVAVVTAIVAGTVPAWRAAAIEPSEALRTVHRQPGRMGRIRLIAGVVCAACGLLLLVAGFVLNAPVNTLEGALAASVTFIAAPFLVLAAGLLGPPIVSGLLWLVAPVFRRTVGGFLSLNAIRADVRRAVGVAIPLMLMVGVACLLLFQDWATAAGKSRNYAERLSVDVVLAGPHMLGVPAAVQNEVAGIPGVAAASGTISSWVYVPQDGASTPPDVEALGVQPSAISSVLRIPAVQGSWQSFTDHGIAISTTTADARHWKLGQRVSYLLPDGVPAQATVDVVYESDNTFAGVLIPRAVLQPHLRDRFDTAVYVRLRPDADQAAVRQQLNRISAAMPSVHAESRDDHLADLAAQSSGDNWIIYLFVLMIAGYAGIAAINALVGSAAGQAQQFALLRLAGARTSHVLAWISAEAGFAVFAGVIQGTVIAAASLIGYGYLLTRGLWLPFPLGGYMLICGIALLVGLVGVLVPARLAMRSQALDANAGS